MKRRELLKMAGVSVATSTLIAPAFGQSGVATFLVAHGGWSAGWSWKKMHPLMSAAGHRLFTPTYTGLGREAFQSRLRSPCRAASVVLPVSGTAPARLRAPWPSLPADRRQRKPSLITIEYEAGRADAVVESCGSAHGPPFYVASGLSVAGAPHLQTKASPSRKTDCSACRGHKDDPWADHHLGET